jgi:hypothetical protein
MLSLSVPGVDGSPQDGIHPSKGQPTAQGRSPRVSMCGDASAGVGVGKQSLNAILWGLPGCRLVDLSSVRHDKGVWKLMLEVALSTDTEV